MSERLLLTHGCSLSNLPLFVAEAAGLFAEQGLTVESPVFSRMSSTSEALATGAADLGTAAFVQPLIDSVRPNPPVMVAGSGLMGIVVLAQPGTADVAELRGRAVGTFRGDPLEVLLHDALAAAGMAMSDIEVHYLDDIAGAMELFTSGRLAALTLAEPHATRLRNWGAAVLSDGTELWGTPFPDTVLVASATLLAERPAVVQAAVRAMIRAEELIAADPAEAVRQAMPQFPGYGHAELAEAARRQPPCVDIRALIPCVLDRWPSLQSLGLVPTGLPAPTGAINLDLLTAELASADPAHRTSPHPQGATT